MTYQTNEINDQKHQEESIELTSFQILYQSLFESNSFYLIFWATTFLYVIFSLCKPNIMFFVQSCRISFTLKNVFISSIVFFGNLPIESFITLVLTYNMFHIIRNLLTAVINKLKTECVNSSGTFEQLFNGEKYTMTFFLLSSFYIFSILRICVLVPLSLQFILIPEIIGMILTLFQMNYIFTYCKKQSIENNWKDTFISHLFTCTWFDVGEKSLFVLHYVLFMFYILFNSSHTFFVIWMLIQAIRIGHFLIKSLAIIENYFIHVQMFIGMSEVHGNHEQCSICLEEMTDKCSKLICGHVFHTECVTEWLLKSHNCPYCLQVASTDDIEFDDYINQLSTMNQFLVKLYMKLYGKESLQKQINQIKEMFPMIPKYVIINDLQRLKSVNNVIDYYMNNPELVDQYSMNNNNNNFNHVDNVEDIDNENNEMKNKNDNQIDENEEDNDVSFEELQRLQELQKSQLITNALHSSQE